MLLGLCSLVLSNAAQSYCESHPTVPVEFRSAPLVLIGKAVAERELTDAGSFIVGTIYTIEVKERLKGTQTVRFDVFSENTTARFPMEIGQSYLMFVRKGRFAGLESEVPSQAVSNCGNSGLLEEKSKEVQVIRKLLRLDTKRSVQVVSNSNGLGASKQ